MQRQFYLILIAIFFASIDMVSAENVLLGGTNVGLRGGNYIDPGNGVGDKSEEQLIDLCNNTNGNFELINRENENNFYEVTFDAGLPSETIIRGQYGRLVYYTCNNGSYDRYFEFIHTPPIYRPDPIIINCDEAVDFEPFENPSDANGDFIKENLSIEIKEKQIDNCTTEYIQVIQYVDIDEANDEYIVFIIEETIIQIDNTAPTFTRIPATATIKCSDYPDDQMINQVTAQDDCGTVTVSFTDSRQPDCSQTTTITRTWTATDACGQSTTAQTVITVLPDEEQPPMSDCEAVTLANISLINQLVIDNVIAPNAILTVFKVSDFGHLRFVWSCSTDCFPQNLLTLERGDYRVNIRFYDENWRAICETDKEIFIGEEDGNGDDGGDGDDGNDGGGDDGNGDGDGGDDGGDDDDGNNGNDGTTTEICNGVQITTTNKYISIAGFAGDGVETKVFDANWNRVFSCDIGECTDPIQIDNVSAGKHFIIFKRYKVGEFGSLTLVCDELVEVTVGGGTIAPLVAAETQKQLPKLKDFQISPNPANDYLYLGLRKYRGEAVNIQVYDQLGNPVLEREIEEVKDDLEYISLHDFDNGVYFIKIHNPRYRAVTQRVVIARMY